MLFAALLICLFNLKSVFFRKGVVRVMGNVGTNNPRSLTFYRNKSESSQDKLIFNEVSKRIDKDKESKKGN